MKLSSVLIISNEEIDIYISKSVLSIYNFADNFYIETSARSALHFLKRTTEIPELILLDLHMKDMNGIDFLNEFQKLPEEIIEKCKVVLLSNDANPYENKMKEINLHKHSSGLLEKPLNIKELIKLIN